MAHKKLRFGCVLFHTWKKKKNNYNEETLRRNVLFLIQKQWFCLYLQVTITDSQTDLIKALTNSSDDLCLTLRLFWGKKKKKWIIKLLILPVIVSICRFLLKGISSWDTWIQSSISLLFIFSCRSLFSSMNTSFSAQSCTCSSFTINSK